MSTRSLARSSLAVALVIGATLVVLAQGQPAPAAQPQFYTLTLTSVHPGMGLAYVEFQKTDVMPAQQKGGMSMRSAWSSGAFGEAGAFAILAPIRNFADFDNQGPMVKVLGEQGAAALVAKGSKLTASRRVLLVRSRPDLSYVADPKAGPAPLVVVTHVETATGRRGDFEALLKNEVVPVMQKAKVKSYQVLEVIYGGVAGTYYTAVGYDTYESLGKGHPFQVVLGEEGAKELEAKFAGITTRVERSVARYRSDLSFRTQPPTN